MSAPLDDPSVLAHELKTPLTAIIGYAEAMSLGAFGPLDEPYVESARTILAAARHLQELIDDLAASVRAPERFDARASVTEVLGLFAIKAWAAGVSLGATPGEEALIVEANPLVLRQILINLIANALAATPRGGRVNVAVGRDGGDLVLAVEDTGPGVNAPEGLGLKLVRALCAGGSFNLVSMPGGGARANVRLPGIA
ncbi:MAG TPA: HAMP domain-containing sensor histidine kinase [Caulobacteraceae bacterium]